MNKENAIMVSNSHLCHWLIVLTITIFSCQSVQAQRTAIYENPEKEYQSGLQYFNNNHFDLALDAFSAFLEQQKLEPDKQYKSQIADARLKSAICQIRRGNMLGEQSLLSLIHQYKPDPVCNEAIMEIGEYYYNSKEYDKAITFYKMINIGDLPIDKSSEVCFKQGYSHFVNQEFDLAQACFDPVAKYKNIYYYPINYYNALCYYFDGNYRQAIQHFKRVEMSQKYSPHIPYYITQIHFQEREYDELIEFASARLDESKYQKVDEIKRLIGKSWYEKSYYERALPYLEHYASVSNKMAAEDFFQLGFVQYQTGKFEEAIVNFKEVANLNNEMAQNANYYIGDSYIKLGQYPSARTAFSKVSKMEFKPEIQEEATFIFGKLSAQLNYDREAVNALLKVPETSKYAIEAQHLINEIFVNTKDYKKALEILSSLDNKPQNVLKTEQIVSYSYGVQLMHDGYLEAAADQFQNAISNNVDNDIKAKAVYWSGDIKYRLGNYPGAIKDLQYYKLFPQKDMDLATSKASASYSIGYAFLKQKAYRQARNHLNEASKYLKQAYLAQEGPAFEMLSDAIIRSGDCSFKLNDYKEASQKYQEAITNEYIGYDYAWFQNALILGLQKKHFEKIITLEELVSTQAESRYADDALFQIGKSYFEMDEANNAAEALVKLIEQYGDKSNLTNKAYLQLGLIQYNSGNVEGALSNYKSIIGNNPAPQDVQDALDAIREIYVQELSKPEEYIAYVDSIPGFESSQFSQDSLTYAAAEFQYDNGDFEKAIKRFSTYIDKFSNGAFINNAHFYRGEAYLSFDRYSKALSDYEAVIKKGAGTHYEKALRKAATIAYNHTKNYPNAYDYYAKLEQVVPNRNIIFESQLGASRAAYRANLNDELNIYAQKVIKNSKASSEERAEVYYYLGKIAIQNGDQQNALDHFNEVVKRVDNAIGAESRFTIAQIYYDRGEFAIAKQLCENINQDNSAYPYWVARNLILYADVLVASKDLFNARAALEAVLENFTDNAEITSMAAEKLSKVKEAEEQNSRLLKTFKDSLQMDTIHE